MLKFKFLWIYISLILIRLLISLTSKSFIHPDEFFQNSEIISNLLFNFQPLLNEIKSEVPFISWEWLNEFPCRSISPISITIGTSFWFIKQIIGDSPSGHTLFISQRLWMFAMSLLIDLSIWSISNSQTTLLLFASSPVVFSFLLRPFSNSIETLLLVIAILIFVRISRPGDQVMSNIFLGAVVALGIFTRVTFITFVLPLLVGVVFNAYTTASKRNKSIAGILVDTALQGVPITLSFLLTSSLLISIDSYYFSSGTKFFNIITPLNSLLFNVSTENLAEHGLHPRYLHSLVNFPMIFGVGMISFIEVGINCWKGKEKEMKEKDGRELLYLALITVPLSLLSIFPHQEPRFLLPLIIPVVLLIPSSSIFKSGTSNSKSLRRYFWTFWILHSFIFTALFGYLHQGGLVPTLLRFNQNLRIENLPFLMNSEPVDTIEFVFWKTFMPPRHLLLPTVSVTDPPSYTTPIIHITDLSGSSPSLLFSTLQSLSKLTSLATTTLLVAPAYLYDTLKEKQDCFIELFTEGLHLDMDRLGELFEAEYKRWGIGVWKVNENCDWN